MSDHQLDVAVAEAQAAAAARPVGKQCSATWWTTPQLKGCHQQHLPALLIGQSRRVWQPRFPPPAPNMHVVSALAAST